MVLPAVLALVAAVVSIFIGSARKRFWLIVLGAFLMIASVLLQVAIEGPHMPPDWAR